MNTTRRGFLGLLAGAAAALRLGPAKTPPVAPPLPTTTYNGLRGVVDDGTYMASVYGITRMENVRIHNGAFVMGPGPSLLQTRQHRFQR